MISLDYFLLVVGMFYLKMIKCIVCRLCVFYDLIVVWFICDLWIYIFYSFWIVVFNIMIFVVYGVFVFWLVVVFFRFLMFLLSCSVVFFKNYNVCVNDNK